MNHSFALSETSTHYQLTVHFMNLFAYFHPDNEAGRMDSHKYVSAQSSEILKTIRLFCTNTIIVTDVLENMKQFTVLDFRIAQLIEYYGEKEVEGWMTSIYGEKVA
jgi:hypothetical protein